MKHRFEKFAYCCVAMAHFLNDIVCSYSQKPHEALNLLVTEERYWALFYMILYTFLLNLLNVVIANKLLSQRIGHSLCHCLATDGVCCWTTWKQQPVTWRQNTNNKQTCACKDCLHQALDIIAETSFLCCRFCLQFPFHAVALRIRWDEWERRWRMQLWRLLQTPIR
jgi:hypothetical protein